MTILKSSLLWLLAICACDSFSVSAEDSKLTLVTYIGADLQNMHDTKVSADDEVSAYVFKIFKEANLPTPEIKKILFSRAYSLAYKGNVAGIFPLNRNVEREKVFNYVSEPVDRSRVVLFTATKNAYIYNGDINSLKNLRLAVLQNASYGSIDKILYNKKSKILRVHNLKVMPRLVLANRIDGFIDEYKSAQLMLKQMNLETAINAQAKTIEIIPSFLALNNRRVSKEVTRKLSDAILRLQRSTKQ